MIITITLTLASLVALNFILLFTSCSKTTKKQDLEEPVTYKIEKPLVITKQLEPGQLAPTGS